VFVCREWDREVATAKSKPRMMRALARCFIGPFIFFGILLYLGVSINLEEVLVPTVHVALHVKWCV
jgi:hypothetical protein